MTPIRFILLSLKARLLQNLLSCLLVCAGVTAAIVTVLMNTHIAGHLGKTGTPIDMVIGAKGSPLQLVLSSLYHVDLPTGNISEDVYDHWRRHPQIKVAIPLALGDSYKGFRIVGTTHDYISVYNSSFAEGRAWSKPMEAVLGAEAALRSGLKLGDRFSGAHGLLPGGHEHHDAHYTVTGILNASGSVLDRLVMTDVKSVQDIHGHHDHEDSHDHDHEDHPQDITAILLSVKSPSSLLSLPRQINNTTSVLAAVPAVEMTRLSSVLGIGTTGLKAFSFVLIGLAGLSVFAGMAGSFESRAPDLAVLRVLGANPFTVFAFVLAEGLILSAVGLLPGLVAGHAVFDIMAHSVTALRDSGADGWAWQPQEYLIVALVLLAGLLAAFIPALRAYRIDPVRVLAKGS